MSAPTDWGDVFTTLSFWYGLPFGDIARMPFAAIAAYLERLPEHQNRLRLLLAETASFPHLEERARNQALRRWTRMAHADTPARPATPADLQALGIAVVMVEERRG